LPLSEQEAMRVREVGVALMVGVATRSSEVGGGGSRRSGR
jgi:hypothetical protein